MAEHGPEMTFGPVSGAERGRTSRAARLASSPPAGGGPTHARTSQEKVFSLAIIRTYIHAVFSGRGRRFRSMRFYLCMRASRRGGGADRGSVWTSRPEHEPGTATRAEATGPDVSTHTYTYIHGQTRQGRERRHASMYACVSAGIPPTTESSATGSWLEHRARSSGYKRAKHYTQLRVCKRASMHA